MSSMVRRLMAVAAILMLAVPAASAQHPQVREGFWWSIGLGGGSLGCENCDDRESGGAATLSFGGTVSDHVLLAGTLSGWGKNENDATLTVGLTTFTVRYYPSATGGFWLTAGLGVGSTDLTIGDNPTITFSESGFGGLAGLGYDIRVGRMISITPWLQWFGLDNDPGSVNVGQLGIAVTFH